MDNKEMIKILAMVLVGVMLGSPLASVYALPTFEELENKRFNELIEEHVAPELRHLTENLTDSQKDLLQIVLEIGKEQITTEQRLMNIVSDVELPTPEEEAQAKKINDTATLKASVPFAFAESPVRYNLDEVNETTEVPYVAPGQISIGVTAVYERQKLNIDREPLEPIFLNETERFPNPWSGNIRFDSGSKSVSYAGMGQDKFIMDCAPGTPYGVIFQNGDDSGRLIVSIQGSEYTPESGTLSIMDNLESTDAPYGVISMSGTCPSFDPAEAEELLSYRPDNQ